MCKIIKIGQVWKSQMNGAVYDVVGVSPTIVCGQHSGVEPKILDVRYERILDDAEGGRS